MAKITILSISLGLIFIFLFSLISATPGYCNINLPGGENCKVSKVSPTIYINETLFNVNDSKCWQGHCNNDGSWLTGISTYNSSYVPYNGATQELNLNNFGLNTFIFRVWEDYDSPTTAQKFSQQQPSQIFMGYWNGTAFRDYWAISYVDGMSKDLKISSTSSTVSLLIQNTIKSYNITSATTNTYSLGSSSVRWLKGWFSGLDVSGDLNQTSGNATINNIYGEFYNKVYGGFETIDLATSEVYVKITNSTCGLQNGFTCVNGRGNLTANVDGVYKVSFTISAEAVSTSGEYGTKLFVNGVGKNNCYAFNNFLNGDSLSGGFNCIVNLNANDVLNIGVDDHANPVRDLIVNSMNLNLMRIGN
jgi:hypothetical protein